MDIAVPASWNPVLPSLFFETLAMDLETLAMDLKTLAMDLKTLAMDLETLAMVESFEW